jgi:WD40 repeat protein
VGFLNLIKYCPTLGNLLDKKLLYSPQTEKELVAINSIAVSPDANKFVSGGSGVINLWDLETKPPKLLRQSDNKVGVNALVFHPKGDFIACAGHRIINLWLSDMERIVKTFYAYEAYENDYPDDCSPEDDYDDWTTYFINCINFSPCGRMLAAGMSIANDYGENELGNNIKIWDIYSENMFKLPGHASQVKSVVFSPDGNTLASGNYDGTIKLWNVGTRKATCTIKQHIGSVCALAFSPDGQTLASGDSKGIIQLLCPHNGRRLQCFQEHTDTINSLAFSTDSKTLVSASSDGYIMIRRRD